MLKPPLTAGRPGRGSACGLGRLVSVQLSPEVSGEFR
jgi:hypothetical protein